MSKVTLGQSCMMACESLLQVIRNPEPGFQLGEAFFFRTIALRLGEAFDVRKQALRLPDQLFCCALHRKKAAFCAALFEMVNEGRETPIGSRSPHQGTKRFG